MDLYRIEEPEELEQLGIDDYLYGSGVSLVEWIDRLPEKPEEYLRVQIELEPGNPARTITVTGQR